MAVRAYGISSSPLVVELDTGGHDNSIQKDIWVRDVAGAEFIVYGSHNGEEGSWRQIDELTVPHGNRDNRYKGLQNAYRFIRVSTNSETKSEIEIVAGEV